MLNLNYKDPFLKDVKKISNPVRDVLINKAPKSEPIKKKMVIESNADPDIKYLGLIKNTTTGIATALIVYNGQSKLIKINEQFEGFVFKSFNKDSLVVKKDKTRLVFRK